MSNVIPQRIAETLTKFPPFSLLEFSEVQDLASDSNVGIIANGEKLWTQGENAQDKLLFLAQGRVEYHWEHDNQAELVDVRDVGDLLGLTALYDDMPYAVTARASDDCLYYEFDWQTVKPVFENNDLARNYIRRHLFWPTRLGNTINLPNQTQARVVSRSKNILQAHLDGAQQIRARGKANLLTCAPTTSVQEVANLMIANKVPSMIVVNEQQYPIGISTYRDLVRRVIVENLDKMSPIEKIMASPVITVENQSSATAALLLMLQKRIGQVCVTEDGTNKTPLLDVCTEKDLLAQSGNHPAGLLRRIRSSKNITQLKELCDDVEEIIRSYLEGAVSSVFVGQICAELYDELIQKLIDWEIEKLEKEGVSMPEVSWSWLAVGSDGRREQLLRTDIDNGILFKSSGDEEIDEQHRSRFVKLGARVIEGMVQCGFSKCQGGVMALNPNWCRTDQEWIQEIKSLKNFPQQSAILRAIIAFDMRRVSGEEELFEQLREYLFEEISKSPLLLKRIAESIVATPPPLNFLKQFVVEKKGNHEGEFDIKSRALSPLRGAAQLLAFKYKLMRRYSTGGRWQDIQSHVENLREIAGYAEESYEFLLRMRTINGLKRGDSGRFVHPDSITKLERAQLTHSFDVVRMVQSVMKTEFSIEN